MFKKKTFCFDKKNGFYEKLGRKIKFCAIKVLK